MCKCGAPPHPEREGRCANSHPYVGFGHELAWKTGEHSTRTADTDGIDAHLAATDPAYRLSMESGLWTQTVGLIGALNKDLRERPRLARNPRIVQQLVALHQQARTLDAELRPPAPPPDAGGAASSDNAAAVRKLARMFRNEPDFFAEFITELLAADRRLAEPLRIALDQLEPTGKPVLRAADDEPDEIIL